MSAQEKALHIDIPVKLTEVKVVFSVASLSVEAGRAKVAATVEDIADHAWTTR